MSLAEIGAGAPLPRGVSKLRGRNKGLVSTSTGSLPNSSGESDDASSKLAPRDAGDGSGGLRASVGSAIDKVKDRTRRRSVDDRRNSDDVSGGRLATLLSKTKRKSKRDENGDGPDRTSSVDSNNISPGNRSELSLLDGSGSSSLLTDDERVDADGHPIRPPFSPHQSHAGLLTLSSPEINAQTTPVVPDAHLVSSPEAVSAADASNIIPAIVEPANVDPLPAPSVPERSPSPANKLRQTFALSRKKSGGDISVKTGGAGSSGFGGLFKSSSRRNSLSSSAASTSQNNIEETQPSQREEEPPSRREEERPETPKQRGRQLIDTTTPSTPPNLLRTPTTVVTPPTPTDPNANASVFSTRTASPQSGSPAARSLSSVEIIRHRRAQSANLPSKLSTSITAPLPPTAEETKTPGGTLTSPTQPSGPAGFFSSVFGAAQKASTQFTSSFTNLPNQKSKSSNAPSAVQTGSEEIVAGTDGRPSTATGEGDRKPLAIATLGQGNLSLSHLGILDNHGSGNMAPSADPPQINGAVQEGDRARKVEQDAAARAVSSAYQKPIAPAVGGGQVNTGRPPSVASTERETLNGTQTPPRSVVDPDNSGIKRSGSVRSKLSGRRKHRGSSATAGTTNSIAEALRHTSTGLANPHALGSGHRMTGFAVASNKRNKDFHQLFRSVPEDDYLIEDYSAALQRDILLHGRLYVSEGHICFSSNILGWVTNLVMSFDEVVAVEKKSTAVIFPNAIVISTLHARNTFASFVARDSTYELLIGIWKISHPNLKSSLNGVTLDDATTGDKTEVAEPDASEDDTEEGSEDEIYDEDADDDADSFADGGLAASTLGSEAGGDLTLSRKPSTIPLNNAPQSNGPPKGLEGADTAVVGAAVSSEYPGAPTHDPTQCGESSEHYDRPLTDTTIPAPLGKVYSMMFGPASGAFMRKWLVEDQKSRDLNYADDKTGLDNDHTTFTFDYIKPLSGPVGPKQTKCITTNTLKAYDLEKAVSVDCSTVTPDVPSGNVFTTKTRYCLMWGPANSTRIIASCTIEWTGKSWLKSPIETGAERGQTEYVKQITAALRAAVTTKPPVKGMTRKGKRKGKKEVFDAEEAIIQREADIAEEKKASGWGPLEPVRQVLEPITSMIRISPSQFAIFFLSFLLAYNWFTSPRKGSNVGVPGYSSPERIAAYEEIWRREESALWDWLEDRLGVEGVDKSPLSGGREQQKVLGAKKFGKQLEDERMSDRQMDEQIRTTEEKLVQLREAVERRKKKKTT